MVARKWQPSPNSRHTSYELEGMKCGVNLAKAVTYGPPYERNVHCQSRFIASTIGCCWVHWAMQVWRGPHMASWSEAYSKLVRLVRSFTEPVGVAGTWLCNGGHMLRHRGCRTPEPSWGGRVGISRRRRHERRKSLTADGYAITHDVDSYRRRRRWPPSYPTTCPCPDPSASVLSSLSLLVGIESLPAHIVAGL